VLKCCITFPQNTVLYLKGSESNKIWYIYRLLVLSKLKLVCLKNN